MVLGSRSRPSCVVFRKCCQHRLQARGISNTISRWSERALPRLPARTRFAPSPTGYLHLGSLRTALYNFLLARATKGQFILRIEDTDTTRTIPDAESRLCEDLRWAGIDWDEGPDIDGPYHPYRQSERIELYKDHAEKLLASNNAYRCFCSAERLNEQARIRQQLNQPTTYDRTCESIPSEIANERAANGEQHTIRLRSPKKNPKYRDLVYGDVGGKAKVNTGGYDDPILLKSDGMPTYHLANVVDDHHMQITHVVRGIEWMPSTPRHLALYEAFGWEPPQFAHVGLLQDEVGQKLSKRGSATDIRSLDRDGIFPEALLNYVALLGWSHRQKSDFLPLPDLINIFDMKFTKGNTIVSPQKLAYLQKLYGQKYIENKDPPFQGMVEKICDRVKASDHFDVSKMHFPTDQDLKTYVASILRADSKHFSSMDSFLSRNEAFFRSSLQRTPPGDLGLPGNVIREVLETARTHFSPLLEDQWMEEQLKDNMQRLIVEVSRSGQGSNATAEDSVISLEKNAAARVNKVLRWAICAGNPGPPMVKTMRIIGKEATLKRLKAALDDCQELELS